MDRTEEIRAKTDRYKYGSDEATVSLAYEALDDYDRDVPYLLERVSQLEQSKDRTQKIAEQLAKDYQAASERVSQLEQENGTAFGVFGNSPHYTDLLVAAYNNRKGAEDHAEFINGVDNEWSAKVEWTKLHTQFDENNTRGWQPLEYLETT